MCAIIATFYCRDCCISAMITVVVSTVGFYGGLWIGGVSGVGDVDIDKSMEGKWEDSSR